MRYLELVLVAILCTLGCSTWKSSELAPVPRLPQTRMSRDSVGIEVATVTLDATNIHWLDEILRELDEQVMSTDKRRRLAKNGFVAGIVGTQLPLELQNLLYEAEDRRQHPTADSYSDGLDLQRFVQCRAQKRVGVGLWNASKAWSAMHDDGELLIEDRYTDASCEIGIRCRPQRNGRAEIKLTPELDHGPLRQRYVAESGAFHIEARRERVGYDDLEMDFQLRPGEILLVTCNESSDLVGPRFFRNAAATKQKILLVRLAQTQIHVSFDDE